MQVLFIVNALHLTERIGILTLSSVLKQAGQKVLLYNVRGRSKATILRDIGSIRPGVLAYSAMSTEIRPLLRINRIIRRGIQNGVKSIFGGPHPTFVPEMIIEEGVDAVCRGEAEASFLLYLEYLEGRRLPDRIPGFLIRDGKDVVTNPICALPRDLDAIPFPDRALWEIIDPFPTEKLFFASRGCPYNCAYCFNHRYNEIHGNPKPVVRRRSVDNFIAEIKIALNRYPEAYPTFDDDCFLMAPLSWLEEFAARYRREIGRPFGCNLRANHATEAKIRVLAEAGWHYCYFGIECGDEAFANQVLRRRLTNERIRQTARLLRSYGVRFATANINALPSDNPLETDLKTLQLNVECKPDFAMAHIFYPFPGTQLAEYSKARGLFDGDAARLDDPLCLSTPLRLAPKEKQKIERLNKLFGPIAAWPWLMRFLPALLHLPLDRLYALAHLLCMGYCIHFRLMPASKGWRFYRSRITLLFRWIARAR
jgi:anaerobic magnesium-protoporphyrin IX monomethyl ester cyclase